jgi:hypothetical protein
MAVDIEVIWVKWEREYFFAGDWTTQIKLNPKENFSLSSFPDAPLGAGPDAPLGAGPDAPLLRIPDAPLGADPLARPAMTTVVLMASTSSKRVSHRPIN